MDKDDLTIGFARRATPYKRADLIFSDLERLRRHRAKVGPLQIVYAGKAHPHDGGQGLIRRIFRARRRSCGPTCGSPTSRTTTWSWRGT